MAIFVLAGSVVVGCGSSEGDENYSKEIKMTAEDKVKEADNMRNSPPPGTIDPATGQPTGASPDALKVPGKSSH